MTLMQWQLGLLIAHELQLSPVCDTKVFSFANEATLQHLEALERSTNFNIPYTVVFNLMLHAKAIRV